MTSLFICLNIILSLLRTIFLNYSITLFEKFSIHFRMSVLPSYSAVMFFALQSFSAVMLFVLPSYSAIILFALQSFSAFNIHLIDILARNIQLLFLIFYIVYYGFYYSNIIDIIIFFSIFNIVQRGMYI